jgi:elongation factor 1-beta
MALMIVTLKIMPENPEVDLEALKPKVLAEIERFAGKGNTKEEIVPIAFGLSALQIIFIMDESLGSTDPLETTLKGLEGVNSVEILDMRRAIG